MTDLATAWARIGPLISRIQTAWSAGDIQTVSWEAGNLQAACLDYEAVATMELCCGCERRFPSNALTFLGPPTHLDFCPGCLARYRAGMTNPDDLLEASLPPSDPEVSADPF